MKIYCESCEGTGQDWVAMYDEDDDYIGEESKKCKSCDGKGYTEPTTITEIERDYYEELGRACEKGLSFGKVKIVGLGDFLPHIELMK